MWKVETWCLKKLVMWHCHRVCHWSSHLPPSGCCDEQLCSTPKSRDQVIIPRALTLHSNQPLSLQNHAGLNQRDHFITHHETTDITATLEQLSLNPQSASPGHTAQLATATRVPLNHCILGYHKQPPLCIFLQHHPHPATWVCKAALHSKARCACYLYQSYDEQDAEDSHTAREGTQCSGHGGQFLSQPSQLVVSECCGR